MNPQTGTTLPPVTVVGAGHWLLAQDRIGHTVLGMLDGRHGPDVELCDVGTGGLAVLDTLRGQELLIVVDACVGRGEPGRVWRVEPDLDSVGGGATSVHQTGPVEALAVARRLFPDKLPRRLLLVLVETSGLDDAGEERASSAAVAVIDEEIERFKRGS